MKVNVSIERRVDFFFNDEVEVPDAIVQQGRQAVEDYVNDAIDEEYEMGRTLIHNHIHVSVAA